MHLTVRELMCYTAEERDRWERWFRENGDEMLTIPISGTAETTIGQLVMHIFGPELRFAQRLRNENMTDYRSLPSESIDQVFGFALRSRQAMREFTDELTPETWNRVIQFPVPSGTAKASIRKVVCHVYIHEIRHWAQVSRLVRERGFEPPGDHDLLVSAALE